MGSTPVATNAFTTVSDLPDYVKPYYQNLLDAATFMAFDPDWLAQEKQTIAGMYGGTAGGATLGGGVAANPIAQGSTGGLGNLVGQNPGYSTGTPTGSPGGGPINLDPNPGTPISTRGTATPRSGAGLMGLGPQVISTRPSGTTYIGTGVGAPAPGGINYNPATGGPITLPGAIPMLPNGQGIVGYGPGSPSNTPGYGTGRIGPIANSPGAAPPPGGDGGTPGGGGYQTGLVSSGAIGSADSVGRIIAMGKDPSIYGWSIVNPSVVPQIKAMWDQLTNAGQTGNQISANKRFADLVAAATGTQAVNNPMIGPYAADQYMLVPSGSSSAPPQSGGGGGTPPIANSPGAAPPGLVSGTGGVSPPHVGQAPVSNRRGGYAEGGILRLADGGTPAQSTTVQGSYPMAPYQAYPGQRVLDPTGMFGFNASSASPYSLSTPTQFGENAIYNQYTDMGPSGQTTFNPADLSASNTSFNNAANAANYGQMNAANQYAGITSNPLQSTYNPMNFSMSQISVNPYEQYQTNAPMAVRPDLSGYNAANAPNINQYPAVAYGVNPGTWTDTGVAQAYMGNTAQVGAPQSVNYGVTPGNWIDQGTSQSYMNPYIQNVDQAQQALINRNFDEQLAQQHGSAAQAGAFGGTRSAVQDSLSNRDRQMQLDAVAAQNLNNAYNLGTQQFNQDRGAQMQAGQYGLQAAMANQGANLQSSLANQASQNLGLGQFNADRGAIMGAGQYGLQADLANQQQAMNAMLANQQAALTGRNQAAGYDIQAQLANQNAGLNAGQFNAGLASTTQNQQVQAMLQAALANQGADLQAQGLTNQSNLSADQQRQAAWLNNQNALNANLQTQQGLIGLQNQTGANQASNQSLQQQLDLQRMQQIMGVGATEDQRAQNILDLGYQNFVNQQNWPYQLSNYYSGILRGVPTSVNQEQFQYQTYNPASQWAGLGLAGLGTTTGGTTP